MFSVAIDGPSGAGKSSVCKCAADKLGFIHVDTGALYRALAYNALKNGINTNDEILLEKLLKTTKIEIQYINGLQAVLVNGENVTDKIRSEEVSMGASNISKIGIIRDFLLDLQRELAEKNNVIMDGRDIGTVVLPNADLKIFLTASPEKRAERRFKQLLEKGEKKEYNVILEDIIKRDYQDSHREIAPLKPAGDSVIVDTSEISFEDSVSKITEMIEAKL